MSRSARPALAAAFALVLGACAGGGTDQGAPPGPAGGGTAPGPSVTAAPGPAPAVPAALDFSAPAVGGGRVDAAAFAGQAALVWFWSPW